MRTAVALAGLVVSMAVVAVGCGGDDESASATGTAEWAEGFCGAITTWSNALEEATDDLRSLDSLSRDNFEQAADDIRAATETFGDDLRDLGAPDTESGDDARQAVDDFAETLDDDTADIESAVDDVSGITEIPAAVTDITAALSSMNAAFSSMLATIREGDAADELETALEDADACSDLG
jgi:hypothetical protein